MNKEDRIAKALNDLGSSGFSRHDKAALSDFIEDYFIDTCSLYSKYNLIKMYVSIIQKINR